MMMAASASIQFRTPISSKFPPNAPSIQLSYLNVVKLSGELQFVMAERDGYYESLP